MPKSIFVDPDKMRAEGKITFKDIPINVYKKSVQEELDEGNYTKEDLIRIFRDMTICREFEDMLNQIKTQARYADVETTYPGPAHLSLGQEAAASDVHVVLGPGLNMKRNPLCGRNFEYFSEDPYSPSEATGATARSWQRDFPVFRSWATRSFLISWRISLTAKP